MCRRRTWAQSTAFYHSVIGTCPNKQTENYPCRRLSDPRVLDYSIETIFWRYSETVTGCNQQGGRYLKARRAQRIYLGRCTNVDRNEDRGAISYGLLS